MFNPQKHHRRSIRLRGYDYSAPGYYFVTVCVNHRLPLLGKIVNGEMRLNDAGKMVDRWWNELPKKFPNVALDEYVVMPNHFHGIIVINETPVGARFSRPNSGPCGDPAPCRSHANGPNPNNENDDGMGFKNMDAGRDPGTERDPGTGRDPGTERDPGIGRENRAPTGVALGNMVAYFKYQTTKCINIIRNAGYEKFWQRNYHDRIIRTESSLNRIRRYIRNNPLSWENDKENPTRKPRPVI